MAGSRMVRQWTRRSAMGLGVAGTVGALAACDLLSSRPAGTKKPASGGGAPGAEGPRVRKGREAPSLAARVRRKELPPVAERLPRNPMRVQPVESTGEYGGTWHTAVLGPDDSAWFDRTVGYENLVRWDRHFDRLDKVLPNVAEGYQVERDGRRYVFALRQGLKWSDGEDFTSRDIVFAYQDFLLEKKLMPALDPLYVSGNRPASLEAPDDHTAVFTFDQPQSLFLYNLATLSGADLTRAPRHYLEKFHATYTKGVDALAKANHLSDWTQLFLAKQDCWANPDIPRLHGWLPLNTFGKGDRIDFERNPYYFKVDPDGSQLPYIDKVVYAVVSDPQVLLLKATNGEIDMQDRNLNDLQNKPVLARNRGKGHYRFFTTVRDNSAGAVVLNLNHPEPAKRAVFTNRDFRVGLSYAINRRQIIDSAYQRQGRPYQVAPRPNSSFYDKELAEQYTEFDTGQANEHLDRAGYAKRNADGVRLRPDGEPLSFGIGVRSDDPVGIDVMQLVVAGFRKVGVDARVENQARGLWEARIDANKHEAVFYGSCEGAGWLLPMLRTDWFFPSTSESIDYAPLWTQWYQTGGAEGERPPPEIRRQMSLYDEVKGTADEAQRDAHMRDLLAVTKDYFFHIGISLIAPNFGIVKDDMRNVPSTMAGSYSFASPAYSNPEQYYFANAERR